MQLEERAGGRRLFAAIDMLGVGVAAPIIVVVGALCDGFSAHGFHVWRRKVSYERLAECKDNVSTYRMCTCWKHSLVISSSYRCSCTCHIVCLLGNDRGHYQDIATFQDSMRSPLRRSKVSRNLLLLDHLDSLGVTVSVLEHVHT